MSYVDFCLIADHNSDRRNGLKNKISSNQLSKDIVQAINCGHGLLYLNQWSEKVVGKQVVIILNAKTPLMGGIEFLRELKKGEMKYAAGNIKIVVIAEDLSLEDQKEYRNHGVVDFMDCRFEESDWELQLKQIFKQPREDMENIHVESKHVYMMPNNTQAG